MNAFRFKKCLVVTKLSKLDRAISNKKSEKDYSPEIWKALLETHEIEKKFENDVFEALKECNVEMTVVDKLTHTTQLVDWADLILPVGGDGTFLIAASKIMNNFKPIVGFNSNPNQSEGRLCLPKKYSSDILGAITKIRSGDFEWLHRTRIRIKIETVKNEPLTPQHLYMTTCKDSSPITGSSQPLLALNEVFLGERLSARVSFLEMTVNEITAIIKCSGICVSTGSGSTAWFHSINQISPEFTVELIKLINRSQKSQIDPRIAASVAADFNQRLIFDPSKEVMAYTIRDLISAEMSPEPKKYILPHNYTDKLMLRSNCTDGYLVIDGGLCFDFNDGDKVFLEIDKNDALKTITMP